MYFWRKAHKIYGKLFSPSRRKGMRRNMRYFVIGARNIRSKVVAMKNVGIPIGLDKIFFEVILEVLKFYFLLKSIK